MKDFTFLSSKEVKPILALLKAQWNFDKKLDYAFFLSDKNRVYIINRAAGLIDLSRLRVNSLGLYFGELRNSELRLSIEGSQIIGPHATKNVVELDNDEKKKWLQGQDLIKERDCAGFVIIKNGNDFFGCGKCKEGSILNFVPKARRLMTADFASE